MSKVVSIEVFISHFVSFRTVEYVRTPSVSTVYSGRSAQVNTTEESHTQRLTIYPNR